MLDTRYLSILLDVCDDLGTAIRSYSRRGRNRVKRASSSPSQRGKVEAEEEGTESRENAGQHHATAP